jgi:FixJ family two-component response regulator
MAPSRKYIVAVVDDDSRILESLGLLLESAGYEVRLYSSAETLLKIDGGLADLDCLISDIDMPVKDGFELQRAAKAAMPRLPVILITGRHDLAKLARTARHRADGLFQKPFHGPDLLEAVSNAVESSSTN